MQTAGFELARSRSRSCVLTDRPTRRRGRVARIELDVYIVHSSKIQYKICMVKSHTKLHPGKKTQPREKFAPSAPHYCPGALHELFIGVAFFGPWGCVLLPWVWVTCATGLAMGNQICSQIPLRIIVARGNSYSGISNLRCMYISDYLLGRIRTDPPRRACEKFWESSMSLANRAPYEP